MATGRHDFLTKAPSPLRWRGILRFPGKLRRPFRFFPVKRSLLLGIAAAAAATSPIFFQAPAQAAACPTTPNSLTFWLALSYPCTTPNNFEFTLASAPGFVGFDSLTISDTSSSFTYSLTGDNPWSTGGRTLNYSITAPTGRKFNNFTSGLTSSIGSGAGADAGSWAVDETAQSGNATGNFSTPTGTNGNYVYSPKITGDTFAGALTVTSGFIQSVNSTINLEPDTVTTPAPLPLLGAGAAFGFSRKLRKRIKIAA